MTLKKAYKIILTPCEKPDLGYIVTSKEPDLQGLVTEGVDEREALIMAYEAAELLLEARGLDTDFVLYDGN